MVSGYAVILFTFLALVNLTFADFEHTCSDYDYYEGRGAARLTVCGEKLTGLVQRRCADKGGMNIGKRGKFY